MDSAWLQKDRRGKGAWRGRSARVVVATHREGCVGRRIHGTESRCGATAHGTGAWKERGESGAGKSGAERSARKRARKDRRQITRRKIGAERPVQKDRCRKSGGKRAQGEWLQRHIERDEASRAPKAAADGTAAAVWQQCHRCRGGASVAESTCYRASERTARCISLRTKASRGASSDIN